MGGRTGGCISGEEQAHHPLTHHHLAHSHLTHTPWPTPPHEQENEVLQQEKEEAVAVHLAASRSLEHASRAHAELQVVGGGGSCRWG